MSPKTETTLQPRDNDVLFVKGRFSKHPGNIVYKKIVDQNKTVYASAASGLDRELLVRNIVEYFRDEGARFLVETPKDPGTWTEISMYEAMGKTARSLRADTAGSARTPSSQPKPRRHKAKRSPLPMAPSGSTPPPFLKMPPPSAPVQPVGSSRTTTQAKPLVPFFLPTMGPKPVMVQPAALSTEKPLCPLPPVTAATATKECPEAKETQHAPPKRVVVVTAGASVPVPYLRPPPKTAPNMEKRKDAKKKLTPPNNSKPAEPAPSRTLLKKPSPPPTAATTTTAKLQAHHGKKKQEELIATAESPPPLALSEEKSPSKESSPSTAVPELAVAAALSGESSSKSPPTQPAPAKRKHKAKNAKNGQKENPDPRLKEGTRVEVPDNEDIIFGRGGVTNKHPGNVTLRQLVNLHVDLYTISQTREKKRLAEAIVKAHGEVGARFLKQDDQDGKWYVVGETAATRKTMQALREGSAKIRDGTEGFEKKPKRKSPTRPPGAPPLPEPAKKKKVVTPNINKPKKPEPTPLEAVAQVNMVDFFQRWLRRIHVETKDPLGLYDSSDDDESLEDGPANKKGRTEGEEEDPNNPIGEPGDLFVASASDPSALLTGATKQKDPPASAALVDESRQDQIALFAREFYRKQYFNKGTLLAMALGLGPSYKWDFREEPFRSAKQCWPTTRQLSLEIRRRCATQNLKDSFYPEYARKQCLEWLLWHPIAEKSDADFVKSEMREFRHTILQNRGEDASWGWPFEAPSCRSLLLQYRKLLGQAEQNYTMTLQSLTTARLKSGEEATLQDEVRRLDEDVTSKSDDIRRLRDQIAKIEHEVKMSQEDSDSDKEDGLYDASGEGPNFLNDDDGGEYDYESSSTREEDDSKQSQSSLSDEEHVSDSSMTYSRNAVGQPSSLDFLATAALTSVGCGQNGVVRIVNLLTTTRSPNKCAALMKDLCNRVHKEGADVGRQVLEIGGVDAVLSVMGQYRDVAVVQLCALAVLWVLAENGALNGYIPETREAYVIVAAMREHLHETKIQLYGCALFSVIANKAMNRLLMGKAGGIDAVLEALRDHQEYAQLRYKSLETLWKLTWTKKNQTRVVTCGGVHLVLKIMCKYLADPITQYHGLILLCNICHDPRNRRIVFAYGGSEACSEAMAQHPSDGNIHHWARKLMVWASGPCR